MSRRWPAAVSTRSGRIPPSFLPPASTSLGQRIPIPGAESPSAAIASITATAVMSDSRGCWSSRRPWADGSMTRVKVSDPSSDHHRLSRWPRPTVCRRARTARGRRVVPSKDQRPGQVAGRFELVEHPQFADEGPVVHADHYTALTSRVCPCGERQAGRTPSPTTATAERMSIAREIPATVAVLRTDLHARGDQVRSAVESRA